MKPNLRKTSFILSAEVAKNKSFHFRIKYAACKRSRHGEYSFVRPCKGSPSTKQMGLKSMISMMESLIGVERDPRFIVHKAAMKIGRNLLIRALKSFRGEAGPEFSSFPFYVRMCVKSVVNSPELLNIVRGTSRLGAR